MESLKYYKEMSKEHFDKLKLYKNVKDLFLETSKLNKELIAIEWIDGKASYEKLYNDVLIMADFLSNKGFSKGDHVGLVFANEYDFVVSFFACSILGIVSALLPLSLPDQILSKFICKFDLKGLVFNDGFKLNHDISSYTQINMISTRDVNFNCDIDNSIINHVTLNSNDPCCIVFTGGTTGIPKGAMLSHINLCRGALNGAYMLDKVFHLKYLSLIPFAHVFGLVKNLLSCIISASTLYIVKNPTQFAKEAMIFQPEVMVLTPGLCDIVLNLIKAYGPNFFGNDFHTIIAGGAHVPLNTIQNFKKIGINCFPGYGLTEATNLISGNVSIDTKAESVGIIYPGQEAKIVNGELYIKGDNVFLGYYNDLESTKEVFDGEWLKTGDLAYFDKDNFLYIIGRKNNLIVLSSGLKISPEEIENIICKNALVKDCLARKKQDQDFITVEILLKENSELNQEKVKNEILINLNKTFSIKNIVNEVTFRNDDFKRTPAMKIIRN